jgi:site-specific recombinase XerD
MNTTRTAVTRWQGEDYRRRRFITALSEKNVAVRVIPALARHSSLATIQRYIDVSQDKLRSAVETVIGKYYMH